MRFWMVFAWLSSALLLAVAQETVLTDDALQKPITVWQRLASLAEVLQDIRNQTGVPLRCQDALRETKLAVYVQNRPAREILEQIASLFGWRWRRDEDGSYVLYLPDETRRALERAQRDDRAATERALREMLRITREWLQMPPDARAAAIEQFPEPRYYPPDTPYSAIVMEETAARRQMTPEQRVKALVANYLSGYSLQGEPPKSPFQGQSTEACLLHCLSEAGDAIMNKLLEGHTLGFSTRPTPEALPLPPRALMPLWARHPDFMDEIARLYNPESGTLEELPTLPNPDWGGYWVRLSAWGDSLEYEAVALSTYELDGKTRKFLRRSGGWLHLPHQEYLAETETWRQWEAWATPMEDWTEQLKERTPLERPKPTVNNERPLLAADALEWLAWHTGYPVISDASRYVLAWYRDSLDNPRALLTWLSNDLWLRFDPSGYLLARHKRFWTLNQFEIPERFVRPLEAKWQAWQWLSLDDYATLAAAITDAQARGFTRVRQRGSIQFWTAFDNDPLYWELPALRFWASLSASQRRRALAGEWVPESTLTLPQRKLFRAALYRDFPPPEQLLRDLPDDYEVGLYVPSVFRSEGVPEFRSEALEQSPNAPAFRVLQQKPASELYILTQEDEFGRRLYTMYPVNTPVSREGVDWKKVFQEAGLDYEPAEGMLNTSLNTILQFALPPRQFEQYLLTQRRSVSFRNQETP
ncbi:MAG: hypothetical protein RQ971_01085 [Armatimonadota bacterium]|nr:hypothetical protein [Armatimonadota bacterium]